MEPLPIALVVNAGGQSRRMGRNKALLPVPPDGVLLVAYILARLRGLASDVVVVVSNDLEVAQAVQGIGSVIVLGDRWAEAGALGGIATGLQVCQDWAMVVACDMPLVEPLIFSKLIEVANSRQQLDAVIPLMAGQMQPFHGLWQRSALPVLEAQIEAGELAVHRALAKLKVAWMDEQALGIGGESLAFANVNTPAEWEEVAAILEKRRNELG